MIIHKDILLFEGEDIDMEGGSCYATLFEDSGKFGWFTEWRTSGAKIGTGSCGYASKLFTTLTGAKISAGLQIRPRIFDENS